MLNKKGPVIITDGNGLIGRALAEKLKDDFHLIIIGREKPFERIPEVQYFEGDLSREKVLREIFNAIKTKWGETLYSVIHLGENHDETDALLRYLDREFDTGQLIVKSPLSVYKPSDTRLTEESEIDPYHYRSEEAVIKLSRRTPFIILRTAPVYDDFGGAHHIIREIMGINEMKLSSFIYPGDKNAKQSVIHVQDLTDVIKTLVQKRDFGRHNLIFNVSEDHPMDIEEIRRLVSKLIHHKEIPVFTVPQVLGNLIPDHDHQNGNYELDSSKLKKFMQWTPRYHLRKVLPVIVNNLQEFPGTWYRANHIERPQLVSMLKARFLKDVLSPN